MASIRLQQVSVSFPVYGVKARSLRGAVAQLAVGGLLGLDGDRGVNVEALRDVSLELRDGDRLGLVGHNGAGKSTLLRVLAGVFEPVQGRIETSGAISALFDPALGMSMDCTGKENIFLRGIYMGFSPAQVARHFDEIAAFTELGNYLSLPLRTYSAGMRLRLAFAVSTSFHPDILLMDEIIGVGDASFLKKAEARLNGFVAKAGIVVLASHSEKVVREMCNRAILLEHGRIVCAGSVDEVYRHYANQQKAGAA